MDEKLEEFKEYFKEDLEKLEKEYNKSEELDKIISKEIEKFSNPEMSGRGTQHYLIEHINSAISLQNQKESLRRSIYTIKKDILNLSIKNSTEADGNEVNEEIQKLLKETKDAINKVNKNSIKETSEENVDDEIERILNEEGDKK